VRNNVFIFATKVRDGRRIALQDAEGCKAILFALERVTALITGATMDWPVELPPLAK
jgi:hypothetical protein